ncbi:MAG: 3-dehydroquinate synthase [Bacteroidales bacterium]|jgi:3-dehydroquinate synthase|nr:3-dehydroquinate synthase [Bacteroidales bacterium]
MSSKNTILFGKAAIEDLKQELSLFRSDGRELFLLVDENTNKHCFPVLKSLVGKKYFNPAVLEISSGEQNKNLRTAGDLWSQLTIAGVKRDAVLLTLGGGVISDMGGFVAATYKRGIAVMHIPTTLLGMIDAAIGGKTGIDFMGYKNHIGAFYQPEKVFVIPEFLKSLDQRYWRSGMGELLKYGFIKHPELLKSDAYFDENREEAMALIELAATAKLEIITKDPLEKGLRKILNFGHTMGHAFESFALAKGQDLLHGEAIAAGMLAELWLSVKYCKLNVQVLEEYKELYLKLFQPFLIDEEAIDELMQLILHDKKNAAQKLNFVLLKTPGKAVFDIAVEPSDIDACLRWYIELLNEDDES